MRGWRRILLSIGLWIGVSIVQLACGGGGGLAPTMQMGPDAEVTHDGLHRLDHTRLSHVWLRPGVDFTSYSKILGVNSGIHYARSERRMRKRFSIPERERELMLRDLTEAFEAALTSDNAWELVEERGPDVLVVRGALIDVVVTAPPEPQGRDRSLVRSLGQATLLIELYDSESLEILGRIADRREIADTEYKLNVSTHKGAIIRMIFRQWARRFREGLDFARTVEWPQEAPVSTTDAS